MSRLTRFQLDRLAERRAPTPPARPTRRFVLTQPGVVGASIVVYFGVRAVTEGDTPAAVRNADRIIDVEQRLGIHIEASLQAPVVEHESLTRLANWIYIFGHWPLIAAVLVWLVVRVPDRFIVYRNAMLISGAVGLVIFALFPVAPPRLLHIGMIDTITQQSHAYRVLQPPPLVNEYASMPSFHAGWDLLIGIALIREGHRVWQRAVGAILPLAMTLSVVVTANHYLLDVAAGMAIVIASLVLSGRLHHRRRRIPAGVGIWPTRGDRRTRGPGTRSRAHRSDKTEPPPSSYALCQSSR